MPNLHIFNPETDLALASDRNYYTPPHAVAAMKQHLCLLPAVYACEGDAVLISEDIEDLTQLPYFDMAVRKRLDLITEARLAENKSLISGHKIIPWGWNKSVRQYFIDFLNDSRTLPSVNWINRHRELAHRRNTIPFLDEFKELTGAEITLPKEIFSVEEALENYSNLRNLYFKAPWSSSGRGILRTSDLEIKHVEPWVKGIIRQQGSVMMEKEYDRALDFATEWMYRNGSAQFLGYSVFKTSPRGKYSENLKLSQSDMLEMIMNHSTDWNEDYLRIQKDTLEKWLGEDYEGPIGIDMLITKSGIINPCVEINLRHTMGMLNLLNYSDNED